MPPASSSCSSTRLYQLLALQQAQFARALAAAHTLLTMPDLLNYWLTGRKVCEFTIATTTQCYDPRARDWARALLEKLGIPSRHLPRNRPARHGAGQAAPWVAEETGAGRHAGDRPGLPRHRLGGGGGAGRRRQLCLPQLGHLVADGRRAARAGDQRPDAWRCNFTNEGGVGGTIRFLKNIIGLWLVQECRRTWAGAGESLCYDELTRMAAEAEPFRSLVDPDRPNSSSPAICRP